MYSCYQTVGTCYPPPGSRKQGQVPAGRIRGKTKVFKVIVAAVLEGPL